MPKNAPKCPKKTQKKSPLAMLKGLFYRAACKKKRYAPKNP
jgi:hypothetical protein